MATFAPEVRGLTVEQLRELIADPDTSRGSRLVARARLRDLTGAGNRGVGLVETAALRVPRGGGL